jgi:hypothetical protein
VGNAVHSGIPLYPTPLPGPWGRGGPTGSAQAGPLWVLCIRHRRGYSRDRLGSRRSGWVLRKAPKVGLKAGPRPTQGEPGSIQGEPRRAPRPTKAPPKRISTPTKAGQRPPKVGLNANQRQSKADFGLGARPCRPWARSTQGQSPPYRGYRPVWCRAARRADALRPVWSGRRKPAAISPGSPPPHRFRQQQTQPWVEDSFSCVGWMKPTDPIATRFSPGREGRNLPKTFVGILASMFRVPSFPRTAGCDPFSCTSTPAYST